MENIATRILFHHSRGDVDFSVRVSFMGFFTRTSMFVNVILTGSANPRSMYCHSVTPSYIKVSVCPYNRQNYSIL